MPDSPTQVRWRASHLQLSAHCAKGEPPPVFWRVKHGARLHETIPAAFWHTQAVPLRSLSEHLAVELGIVGDHECVTEQLADTRPDVGQRWRA